MKRGSSRLFCSTEKPTTNTEVTVCHMATPPRFLRAALCVLQGNRWENSVSRSRVDSTKCPWGLCLFGQLCIVSLATVQMFHRLFVYTWKFLLHLLAWRVLVVQLFISTNEHNELFNVVLVSSMKKTAKIATTYLYPEISKYASQRISNRVLCESKSILRN